jgi:hypothetical protein
MFKKHESSKFRVLRMRRLLYNVTLALPPGHHDDDALDAIQDAFERRLSMLWRAVKARITAARSRWWS